MTISVYIDNNAWDIFFAAGIELSNELPNSDFSLCITREAEFEIPQMPEVKREYVNRQLKKSQVKTDTYFGFYDESLPPDQQRVSGFGSIENPDVGGRFIEENEAAVIHSEAASIGPGKRPTGLFKNEADVSLAARSIHSVVLTCDGKKALKRAKDTHGGLIVDLKKYQIGTSLAAFIKQEIAAIPQ